MKRKLKQIIKLASIFLLATTNTLSFADTAQMNATLSRISHVLSELNPLIQEAAKEQDPNARVQFQFDQLQADVGRMQAGILEAINGVSIQPRVEPPLLGDYLPISNSVIAANSKQDQEGSS